MTTLGWIILGAVAGWIASVLTRSRDGLLMDTVIGIVGAFIGGFVSVKLGGSPVSGLNIPSLFLAVVGAVVLILVVRALRTRSS